MMFLTACGDNAEKQTNTEVSSGETTEDTSKEKHWSEYDTVAKVLCYNIYYQNIESRSANVIDLILKNDPDVLLLQEVSVEWIPYLQTFMAENGYSYYGYGRYGGELSAEVLQSGDQFTPVLWKTEKYDLVDSGHFWLSDTPEVQSAAYMDGTVSNYPRCVNWAILKDKEAGKEFLTTSVHTAPGGEDKDRKIRAKSSYQIATTLNEIRDGRPAILAGDWNMGLTDDAFYAVTENGYRDVRAIAEDTVLGGSYNGFGKYADGNYAYGDHIFVTDNAEAKCFSVVDDYYNGEHASDHNPLYTEIYY